eukprot:337763-Pelagomonas_calceolata.AAC.1
MKEIRKFVVVLVQESRHIMRLCLREQWSIFPAGRDHLGMCAMEEDTLFILDIIISHTKVTVWGRAVIPSCCLIAMGVNAEFKPSHTANDIMGEVKEHVFGESTRRMHNKGPLSRRSTPLVIGPIDLQSISLTTAG